MQIRIGHARSLRRGDAVLGLFCLRPMKVRSVSVRPDGFAEVVGVRPRFMGRPRSPHTMIVMPHEPVTYGRRGTVRR